jgi:hypothetical protein
MYLTFTFATPFAIQRWILIGHFVRGLFRTLGRAVKNSDRSERYLSAATLLTRGWRQNTTRHTIGLSNWLTYVGVP